MTVRLEFGTWRRLASIAFPGVAVEPLVTARAVLENIAKDEGYSRGWIYPPLRRVLFDDRPDAPQIPVDSYGLPATHTMTLSSPPCEEELADFLIAMIGFVDGVRLVREGWSHFYKAPIELHQLTDIYPDLDELVEVLRLVRELWVKSTAEVRSRLFAAVHWFQFSSLMEHEFERFGGMYSVLDTLFWLHKKMYPQRIPAKSQLTHAGRIPFLASEYDLPLPAWAVESKPGESAISKLRNELVHEARYAGEATGFTFPSDFPDIAYELGAFVNRLIYAVFQIPCLYSKKDVTSKRMHSLYLMRPLPLA